MAGKKKKKPAANPARGFATTSLPSKPKAAPVAEELLPAQQYEKPMAKSYESPAGPQNSHAEKPSTEKDVAAMTPTEFEEHLEQSELQYLVDTHAARVKSDAARQVARLDNEKRQLRQLADRASIAGLSDQLVDEILVDDLSALSHGRITKTDENDLLLKLWALREVLMGLQMPSIDDALTHALTVLRQGETPSADDYISGLNDTLMWYARTQDPRELPDYETGKVQAASVDDGLMDEIKTGKSVLPKRPFTG